MSCVLTAKQVQKAQWFVDSARWIQHQKAGLQLLNSITTDSEQLQKVLGEDSARIIALVEGRAPLAEASASSAYYASFPGEGRAATPSGVLSGGVGCPRTKDLNKRSGCYGRRVRDVPTGQHRIDRCPKLLGCHSTLYPICSSVSRFILECSELC